MSIVQQKCPACSAPLPIQPGQRRLKCVYCGSALSIERHGDEISVELAEQVIGRIEQSGAQAQAEFQRIRLTQELHSAEMRLANVQSEIRSIQRGPVNAISRTHLNQLHNEQVGLQKEIATIKVQLDPDAAPAPVAIQAARRWISVQQLVWLLFSFEGRANRLQFWIGVAIAMGIFVSLLMVMAVVDAIPPTNGIANGARSLLNLVGFVQMVVALLVGAAIVAKRYHDRGKSGWWALIILIPFGLLWLLLELGTQPGSAGPNQYG